MTQHGALTAAAAMRIAAAVQSLNGEVLVETRAPCGLSGGHSARTEPQVHLTLLIDLSPWHPFAHGGVPLR